MARGWGQLCTVRGSEQKKKGEAAMSLHAPSRVHPWRGRPGGNAHLPALSDAVAGAWAWIHAGRLWTRSATLPAGGTRWPCPAGTASISHARSSHARWCDPLTRSQLAARGLGAIPRAVTGYSAVVRLLPPRALASLRWVFLESRSLFWAGRSPPARWHALRSCEFVMCRAPTAQEGRGRPARRSRPSPLSLPCQGERSATKTSRTMSVFMENHIPKE